MVILDDAQAGEPLAVAPLDHGIARIGRTVHQLQPDAARIDDLAPVAQADRAGNMGVAAQHDGIVDAAGQRAVTVSSAGSVVRRS